MLQTKSLLLRIFPPFTHIPFVSMILMQILVYGVTKLIASEWNHYMPSLAIDKKIPFAPAFIIPYVLCYAHWVFNFMLSAHTGKERFYLFAVGVLLSQIICGIIFLIYPTTIHRPEVNNLSGISGLLIKAIYAADTPVNLFPSMHCLLSWWSWIAIRDCPNIPTWYQWTSFAFGIVVCLSTVFIKQHFVVDIFAGITLAEVCWGFSNVVAPLFKL